MVVRLRASILLKLRIKRLLAVIAFSQTRPQNRPGTTSKESQQGGRSSCRVGLPWRTPPLAITIAPIHGVFFYLNVFLFQKLFGYKTVVFSQPNLVIVVDG